MLPPREGAEGVVGREDGEENVERGVLGACRVPPKDGWRPVLGRAVPVEGEVRCVPVAGRYWLSRLIREPPNCCCEVEGFGFLTVVRVLLSRFWLPVAGRWLPV